MPLGLLWACAGRGGPTGCIVEGEVGEGAELVGIEDDTMLAPVPAALHSMEASTVLCVSRAGTPMLLSHDRQCTNKCACRCVLEQQHSRAGTTQRMEAHAPAAAQTQ